MQAAGSRRALSGGALALGRASLSSGRAVVAPPRAAYSAASAARGAAAAPLLGSRATGFFGVAAPLTAVRPVALQPARGFRASTSIKALKTGIVGLPNVGKSTMFNALVKNAQAQAANFPFCTIEPNSGIVPVPDARLQKLSDISGSENTINTTCEFVDIAGLVKGASEGEGLGNKFLGNIRECDALVQVVRCFDDENVIHVNGTVNPVDDVDVINFELALSDIEQIERRVERLTKQKRVTKADEAAQAALEKEALDLIMEGLEKNVPARKTPLREDQAEAITHLNLLTMKPLIYAANVGEDDLHNEGADNEYVNALRAVADKEGCSVVVVSAQVESELNALDEEDANEFLEALGVTESSLNNLIRATYQQLGLRTYFTSGEKETRAWTYVDGMTAPQAAGVIHTDFEKGFIRAETVAYDDYVEFNGTGGAKENGKLRLEGKEYVVQEGDVMLFRFNV